MRFLITTLTAFSIIFSHAQHPGDLDTTFGNGGYVLLEGSCRDIIESCDGRILVLTQDSLTRIQSILPNGQIDTLWGTSGSVVVDDCWKLHLLQDGTVATSCQNGWIKRISPTGVVQGQLSIGGYWSDINQVTNRANGNMVISGELTVNTGYIPCGRTVSALPNSSMLDAQFGNGGEVFDWGGNNPPYYFKNVMHHRYVDGWQGNFFIFRETRERPWGSSVTNCLIELVEYETNGMNSSVISILDSSGMVVNGVQSHCFANNKIYWHSSSRDVDTNPLVFSADLINQRVDTICSFSDLAPISAPPSNENEVINVSTDQHENVLVLYVKQSICRIGKFLGVNQADSAFGQNGILTTTYNTSSFAPKKVISAQNGKVLFAGQGLGPSTYSWTTIARYHNIPDPRKQLAMSAMLLGPYDAMAGLIHDSLMQQGLVPSSSPYPELGHQLVNNTGCGQQLDSVPPNGPDAIVDWVFVELISADDSAVFFSTSALIHRNGNITAPDGFSTLDIVAPDGDYFVKLIHRNHLSVTTQSITFNTPLTTIDLTNGSTPVIGTDAMNNSSGVHVLWPGDVTHDQVIKYAGTTNDRDPILLQVGGSTPTNTASGYLQTDVNMDGVVKYTGSSNDRDIILQVIGGTTPTAVKVGQGLQ